MSDEIRDVWESNLEQEMATIRELLVEFPYIAMVGKRPLPCLFARGSRSARLASPPSASLHLLPSAVCALFFQLPVTRSSCSTLQQHFDPCSNVLFSSVGLA